MCFMRNWYFGDCSMGSSIQLSSSIPQTHIYVSSFPNLDAERKSEKGTLVKYDTGEQNDRGDGMTEANIFIASSLFQQKAVWKWARIPPSAKASGIDLVLVDARHVLKDVFVVPLSSTESNHNMLQARILKFSSVERRRCVCWVNLQGPKRLTKWRWSCKLGLLAELLWGS